MKRKYGLSGSESGQGTIEYILILVITVSIVMTLLWQYNTAFRVYAEAFFDGYVACLLETGELPGTSVCEFKSFDINDGHTVAGGSSFSSSGGGGSGSSGKSNQSQGGNGSGSGGSGKTQSQTDSGSGGGGAGDETLAGRPEGGSGSGPVGRVGQFGRFRQRSTAVGSFQGTKDESAFAGADALIGPLPGGGSGATSTSRSGTKTALGRDFSYFGMEDDQNKEASRPAISAVSKKGEGNELRPKVAKEVMRKPAASRNDQEESGFTMGNFLKIILIVGIVIAILVFFGGQLLQISKSWEK